MTSTNIIIIIASVIGVAGLSAIAFVLFGGGSRGGGEIRGLMAAGGLGGVDRGDDLAVEEIKKRTGSAKGKKGSQQEDIATKLFRAGFFSSEDRRRFRRIQIIAPLVSTPAFAGMMIFIGNPLLTTVGIILGIFVGYAAPMSWLERQIRQREEDSMYYLPLVIEQISIGVSSSLDIGPCINHIVTMARERDSHNPVTEMFVHVEKLLRSGLSLEDALNEVGEASGMSEVKHAFMFLGQCAKHGGELSKQLQELADSVMVQRQVQVEARISALPVKATGPLATVFAGFFALLFAGLFVRLMGAFGN